MSWRQARRKDFPLIIEFGKRKECLCVPFTSRLKNDEKRCTILVHKQSRYVQHDNPITEAVMITRHGLVLPIFDRPSSSMQQDVHLSTLLHRHGRNVYSVMGIQKDVLKTRNLLALHPKVWIDYLLMYLTKKNFRQALNTCNQDVEVRQAGIDDAHCLFRLQREYEFEEVLLKKDDFNEKRSLSLFQNRLRNNLAYMGIKNGFPVAQAGTNARGFDVDQIGGVYTCKNERNKGIATLVMGNLLTHIFLKKSMVSLFVKKTNAPAISLYKKLGFRIQDPYRIEYFYL